MNISLTPEFERRIAEMVDAGLYSTASEVVRSALRLMFERDVERERLRAEFDTGIQLAIDQLDRGEGISPEESDGRIAAIIERHRRKAG
jgi:antitoxin ParD1/3/4